ncbi:MAG: FHA domain-containing protein [Chloroflexi bacterium]|nr:FHA domain-containing protein [Chloroflexota bacterium]
MSKIARFEALAERLVEGTFARLFAGRLSPLEVATHLTRAIEDNQVLSPGGAPQAPTHYWVYLHPDACNTLAIDQQTLETELAHHVAELAVQAEMALKVTPVVHVLPDEGLGSHEVRVKARWMPEETEPMEKTHEMKASDAEAENVIAPPGRPFLILGGQRHTNLLQPVVSIGRALDNDVIIEDPRVSRHHAQLRRRYGRYVLYDLGSSGGTQINDYPIEECVLHAGDVISLAGVHIIYSEDPPTPIMLPDDGNTPLLVTPEPSEHEPDR